MSPCVGRLFTHSLRRLSSFEAVQKLEILHCSKNASSKARCISNDAYNLFTKVDIVQRDHHLFNCIFNVLLTDYNRNGNKQVLQWMVNIYRDIMSASPHSIDQMSERLLIRCCKKTLSYYFDETVNVLSFVNSCATKVELINICANPKHLDLVRATDIFNSIEINDRSTVCINVMMKCYVNNQQAQKALALYEQYNNQIQLNDISNVLYLKACIKCNELHKGNALIRGKLMYKIRDLNINLVTTIIDFYGYDTNIDDAISIFESMELSKQRNVALVNAMINCYIKHHKFPQAIDLHERFADLKYDDISTVLYLKACKHLNQFESGKNVIEQYMQKNGKKMSQHSIQFMNTMLDFYGHFGEIKHVIQIFNNLPKHKRDTISINNMMNCYIKNEEPLQAIRMYEKFRGQYRYSDVSNTLYLKACILCNETTKAEAVVNRFRNKLNQHSIQLVNTVIEFYGHTGRVQDALSVFNQISNNKKDIVTMSNMMNCYIKSNQFPQAIKLYDGFHAKQTVNTNDDISNVLYLKACIKCNEYDKARTIIDEHAHEMNQHSAEFINAAIDLYGHTGNVQAAWNVFSNMPESKKDIISITAMIQCYANNKLCEEALTLFEQYACNDTYKNQMDAICYSVAIDCCGELLNVLKGEQIVQQIPTISISRSVEVTAAIIRMYAKCGNYQQAISYFERNVDGQVLRIEDKNGYIYASIMDCYGKQGDCGKVLSLFHEMKRNANMQINQVIYNIVLTACSHAGLLQEAKAIYREIVEPNVNLTNTVIDAFARKNELDEAESIYRAFWNGKRAEESSEHSDALQINMITSILSSCRVHNDVQRAQRIFEEIKHENKWKHRSELSAVYLLMTNMYAQNKQYDKLKATEYEMTRCLKQ